MTVSIVSLGCAKNLVDSERMLAALKKGGYTLTAEPADADIAIVNTCGFIQSAKEEAIETILEIAELKASLSSQPTASEASNRSSSTLDTLLR